LANIVTRSSKGSELSFAEVDSNFTGLASDTSTLFARVYTPVANIGAIPASPGNGDRIEISDSTGIRGLLNVQGIPSDFPSSGDISGLQVRLQYSSSLSAWQWVSYAAKAPDGRYGAIESVAAAQATANSALAGSGMRNALINANPIINQRGYVSGTATTTANQYTLDRWRVVTSGQSISWSDNGNVRTVVAPAGGVEQVIEGASLFTGSYTLSWSGTATAVVAGAAVAKGGTVSLAGGVNTAVRFSNGTLSLPQLEPGGAATAFEQRPCGQELALCQRYFEVLNGRHVTSAKSGISDYVRWPFKVVKRVAPTMTFAGGSAGYIDTLDVDGVGLLSSDSSFGAIGTNTIASAEL
jgi:hypothetical protein